MENISIGDLVGENGVFVDGDWVESKDQDPNGAVLLIQLADIGDSEFINKSKRFLTLEKAKILKCTFLSPGDVLIARMPDPIGRACIFPKLDTACVTVVDVCIVRPNRDMVLPEYLMYLINSPYFRNKISKFVTGTTRQRISRSNLNNIKFNIPSKDEQKQIVNQLNTIKLILSKRTQSIQKLDELLQSAFYNLFGDPNSEIKYPPKKLNDLIVPNGLVDGPFGSSVNTKVDYIDNGEIPVIRTKNVSEFRFITDDLKYMSRNKYMQLIRSHVLPGDIVLTKVGTIGNVCIFPREYKEAILSTTGSCRIRNDNSVINTVYLAYYLHYLKPTLNRIASTGVQAFLNLTHIKNLDISLPPFNLQNKFNEISEVLNKQKLIHEKSSEKMEDLFQSLLQQSFNEDVNQYAI